MVNRFDKDAIGKKVLCLLEKDGVEKTGLVKWTHCFVGEIVKYTEMVGLRSVTTNGWKIVETDVNLPKGSLNDGWY